MIMPAQTVNSTKALINSFGWDIWNYLAYCPDLAPSNFYLFTFLKTHMTGKYINL
jgi:hypothetical protein